MATLAELIAQYCADFGQDYPAIAARLNAATEVANPDAGKVTETVTPTPISLKALLSIVPPAEGATIYSKLPGFVDDLRNAIDNQDREYLGGLLNIAYAGGAISQQTAANLAPLLTATTTTTTTAPETIAGPSLAAAAGLGVVTERDVQAALN